MTRPFQLLADQAFSRTAGAPLVGGNTVRLLKDGNPFEIVELPMPRPIAYDGQRVPATYVNFYFANGALLVPTFGQRDRDHQAIRILQRHLPTRRVIGVDCRKLIWGLGAIHCFTQQQPQF